MEVMKAWKPNKAYPKGSRKVEDNGKRVWRLYVVTAEAGFAHVPGETEKKSPILPFEVDNAGKCPILSERDKPPLRSAF